MNEFFLQQAFGNLVGSAEIWLAVAYVLSMFAVLAFRPEQIGNPVFFRLSYVFFALFLILPSAVTAFTSLAAIDGMGGRRGGEGTFIVLQLSGLLGRLLLAGSIVSGLAAMKRRRAVAESWEDDGHR